MNLKGLVKLTNVIALISIVLLIYWVFVFVSTEVFGLRIFRENISQTFAFSVLGILSLLGGSLMINVMFNLTRIAEKHNQDVVVQPSGYSKTLLLAFILSFPVIFGLLFAGDLLTSRKKQNMLVSSARSIIDTNEARSDKLLNYGFNDTWLSETRDTLEFFERTERNFPNVSVIVKDTVDDTPVFLAFREYHSRKDDSGNLIEPEKRSYLLRTTDVERQYLESVINGRSEEIQFSASDGNYELFYPYRKEGKTIVLYFSDYQRYGKMGS